MKNLLPIVIDFEASGLANESYPIEVGYVTAGGATWCSLITPLPTWQYWDKDAEKLHHVPRETLIRHGKDIIVVASHLNQALRNETVYSDAWSRDFVWLNKLFDAADMALLFKLEDINTIMTENQRKYWDEANQAVKARLKLDRHRASMDAKVIQLTWAEAKAMAGE